MIYYIAVDTGGTLTKCAVVSSTGQLLEKKKWPTPTEGFLTWLEKVEEAVDEFKKKYTLSGIAMSFPGAVNEKKDCIEGSSAVAYIHRSHVLETIEERLNLKASMANDANCMALCECWLGVSQNDETVAYLVLGTGIGGALVHQNKLHPGAHLHGGEFGYMIVEGKIWSEVASTHALVQMAKRQGVEISSGEELFKSSSEDALIQAILKEWYRRLAIGIYNIQYIYDPDCIVIGGGVSEQAALLEEIQQACDQFVDTIDIAKIYPQIKRAHFKGDANLIGAVYHHIQKGLK